MNRTLFVLLSLFVSISSSASDLGQALEKKFEKYKEAQQWLLNEVVDHSRHGLRQDLEKILSQVELTESQTQELKEMQKQSIEKARMKAFADSIIKLNDFRSDKAKVKKFCSLLPKGAMLHVHPDGTMDRKTVKELLEQGNPKVNGPFLKQSAVDKAGFDLYPYEIEFLESLVPTRRYLKLGSGEKEGLLELFFLPKEPYTHEFSRFMSFFFIKGIVHKREDGNRSASTDKIYRDFFARAQKQKVIYVEFTASIPAKKWALENLARIAKLALDYDVVARWNISFYRNNDAQKNETQMKQWIDFIRSQDKAPEFIVGIDFLADESTNPALEKGQGIYIQALEASEPRDQSRSIGLKRTMHAGELGNPNNVRDAMIMGVQRVGHGVKLMSDPVALEYARKMNLGIETNLVSNIRLRIVDDLKKHPFIKYLRLGLPVSFSTDDEGLFETTMNKECEEAVQNTDIQYSELKKIAYNGIESSFAKPSIKEKLKAVLKQSFKDFEKQWPSGE